MGILVYTLVNKKIHEWVFFAIEHITDISLSGGLKTCLFFYSFIFFKEIFLTKGVLFVYIVGGQNMEKSFLGVFSSMKFKLL